MKSLLVRFYARASRDARRWFAVASWLCCLAALGQAGCSSSADPAEPALESRVVVPPVVCGKDSSFLRVFASYSPDPNICTGAGCFPLCGGASPPCPDGTACDGGVCMPAACASPNDPVCTGGTQCNPTSKHCELLACADDSTCPCGTSCDVATGHCRMSCFDGPDSSQLGISCPGGLICDGRGQCSPANGVELPSQEVTLDADPGILTMVPDGAGAWPVVNVTVTVSTANPVVSATPAPVVRAVPGNELLVACDGAATPGAAECAIRGAGWTYSQTTTPQGVIYVASRVIGVQVKSGSTAKDWQLTLITADGTKQQQVHAVLPVTQVPGRYRGTLTIGSGTPATTVAIQATVTDSAIVLHDPTRVLSPTGSVLLPRNQTAKATSFLGGKAEPAVYNKYTAQYQLSSFTAAYDPALGETITGALSVLLSASSSGADTWSFVLSRTGDLQQSPCPAGETFDAALNACTLGVPWDDTAFGASTVTVDQATHWLDAVAGVVGDPLLTSTETASLAERLVCYDKDQAANPGFGLTTSPVSGDLVCGGASGIHSWWAVGLVSLQDRGASVEQLDMLSDCLDQINREPPLTMTRAAIGNDSCISLARFYPALLSAAGAAPYRGSDPVMGTPALDRRNRALATRLLQQWAELIGFIANNGAAQRSAADWLTVVNQLTPDQLTADDNRLRTQKSSFSYESLLDTVDRAQSLLFDKRIQTALSALRATEVAAPDYRVLHQPDVYWNFDAATRTGSGVNPVVGATSLLSAAGCPYSVDAFGITWAGCKHLAVMSGLDRDLTVALRLRHDASWSGSSILFDSDGLVIREDSSAPGASPTLFVGHHSATTALQGATFKIVIPNNSSSVQGATVIIRRDVLHNLYLVSGGSMADGDISVKQSYALPPIVSTPTVEIGGGRTAGAMNGWVAQVAIWNYAMSEAETQALRVAYHTPNVHAAWPAAGVTLPASTDLAANEATVGLPALWLESLIPTMRLIEAYIADASLANAATCRQGYIDDSVRRAEQRAGRSLRISYAVEQLARKLHDKTTASMAAWATRYDQALSELLAARAKTVAVLGNAEACQNPLGIGPKEFPLYFATADISLPANLLEASANFLKGLAGTSSLPGTAIGDASSALVAARDAWRNQYTSHVQDTISDDQQTQRLDDIRSSFGRDLVDLCGVSGDDAVSVLQRFLDPASPKPLASSTCFIDQGLCAGAENTPLGTINPSCLRGEIGEAWLAAQSASQRVARARDAWEAARQSQDLWNRHCAEQEEANNQARDFSNELADLESAEAEESSIFGIVDGIDEAVTGIVITAASGGAAGPAGLPMMVGGIEKATNGATSLASGDGDRKAALEALLRNRALDQADADCRHQADLARLPLDGAFQDINVALADLKVALLHAQDLQTKVDSTVIEAKAAVAREQALPRPRLGFHYWADEALAIFQTRMARARRLTYLFLRAVEHDLQKIEGLDAAVLGAVHPEQLSQIAIALGNELLQGMEQRRPGEVSKVISLCQDVLHLPELNGETNCDQPKSRKQFRDILFSPANAIYEAGGYLGQAIPFRLTPDLAGIEDQCAERLSAVDAQVVGEFGGGLIELKLDKRETFYSETCRDHVPAIGPIQEGTLRSSNNLFVDGTISSFGLDRPFSRAPLVAQSDSADPDFATRGPPGPHASTGLAGRGMFGDYVFIVPGLPLGKLIDASDVRDVRIRFDFVAIENNGPSVSPGTPKLATELRDGAGAVIDSSSGNTVSSSCTSCTAGAAATLTATPASGWHFGGWTGACIGDNPTCSVAMNAPHKAWATFVDDRTFTVAVTAAGTGTGDLAGGWLALTGGATAPGRAQSAVHLVPRPAASSYFTGWTGACAGFGTAPCDLTLSSSGAMATTANFALRPTLTINVAAPGGDAWQSGGAGLVPWIDHCYDSQCSFYLDPNQSISMTAGSQAWGILSWAGDCAGSAASCALTMTGNKTVTVNLRPWTFVRANPVPLNGFINFPIGGGQILSCGLADVPGGCGWWYLADSTMTVTAEEYVASAPFSVWTGDAAVCGANPTCSLVVRAGMNISASFPTTTGGGGGGGGGCLIKCN